ncbi:MAG: DUF433 domain-containing protein [Planctomycetes bacterium]|nr:DUF433 domain-containing protein [Planctomycetota bacterium]
MDPSAELPADIERNPAILGGTPIFRGTRVPLQALLDHVAAGNSITTFLDDFPSIDAATVERVLAHWRPPGGARASAA